MSRKVLIATSIAALCFAASAGAAELQKIAEIAVPGAPLTSFDIGFVDPATQRYYLADRSNKGLDIFDAKDNKYIGRVGGFIGAVEVNGKVNNDVSGPDGVVVFDNMAWVGDGDSTVKIIDLKAMKVVDSFSTGGKSRLDEMALDSKDKVFIGVNNAEEPPFATLVSTKSGHKILAKISFPDATDGAEQPDYNAADGMFYMSIPEMKKDAKKGGVAVIDPRTAKLVKILPVDNCHPNGLAFGPNQNFALGCTADGKEMPAIITIMNAKTGKVVAEVADIGAADMVAYSKKNNQYYTASRGMPGGPVLGVIDAKTNKLVQKVALKGGNPHSVAVNDKNGYVFVPVGAQGGGCSCIQVYALK
jgi:DNA-binding beta-propeller fold protein YncE